MTANGALRPLATAGSSEPDSDLYVIVRSCIRRVRHWRVPPNWTGSEWLRELAAHGEAAAHEAACQYDPTRGADSAVFVKSRVMGRLLTRYRQEWNFGSHVVHWCLDSEEIVLRPALVGNSRREICESLMEAVDQLPETDRWLVVQIFWKDRDQSELARELGVSQPAISKRYRNIVRRLQRSNCLPAGGVAQNWGG